MLLLRLSKLSLESLRPYSSKFSTGITFNESTSEVVLTFSFPLYYVKSNIKSLNSNLARTNKCHGNVPGFMCDIWHFHKRGVIRVICSFPGKLYGYLCKYVESGFSPYLGCCFFITFLQHFAYNTKSVIADDKNMMRGMATQRMRSRVSRVSSMCVTARL